MTIRLGHGQFYGRTVLERSTAHLNLVLTQYAAGERLPVHAHERPYLALALCGGFRERVGGLETECGEGALVLNTVAAEHSDHFLAERSEVLNVELDPEWVVALRADGWRDPRPAWIDRLPVRARLRQLRAELAHPDRLSPLVIEGLCAELVGRAAWALLPEDARPARPPAWLARIEVTIAERFRHPPGLVGSRARSTSARAISRASSARATAARSAASHGGCAWPMREARSCTRGASWPRSRSRRATPTRAT